MKKPCPLAPKEKGKLNQRKSEYIPNSVKGSRVSARLEVLLDRFLDGRSQALVDLGTSVEANNEIQKEIGIVPVACFSRHGDVGSMTLSKEQRQELMLMLMMLLS